MDESKVLFSGAVFDAQKAIQLGLVDDLYTVLEDEVGEWIDESNFKLVKIENPIVQSSKLSLNHSQG